MSNKISVIIPTYNRAHTIEKAINSVIEQTHQNWECLIIDDGSQDKSIDIISQAIKEDDRFYFIKRPSSRKKGAASCRNIGLEHMSGDFVQFLDSDDYISKNKFETQLSKLKNANIDAVATCRYGIQKSSWTYPKVFAKKEIFKNFDDPSDLFRQFAINFSYFPLNVYLIPKNVIKSAGLWNEDLSVNDDGEYFCRVMLKSSEIVFCKESYAVYRTGAGNRLTGKLRTPSGIESFVQSWNLIDKNIYAEKGVKNHIYVQMAKRELQHRLAKENPALINKYKEFLNGKWSYFPFHFTYFLHKVRSRLFLSYTEEKLKF